jgi:quercetin dioxygenase-like cupin family protein
MLRSPTTIHVRKHWHSHNETHTVLKGTQVYACDDKKVSQPPGSFNRMPAKVIHEAWVPGGSLVFITMDGEWDIHWVDGEPTAADLTK